MSLLKRREKRPRRGETLRALTLAILLALGIRSFVIEPFKIPSGSMIPTLLIGDYLLVNKFAYGLRLPFTGQLLIPIGEPSRGDIVVFRYPDDPRTDFIKRVVGVGGDKIVIDDAEITVNGKPLRRVSEGTYLQQEGAGSRPVPRERYREVNTDDVEYTVLQSPHAASRGQRRSWTVPDGSYFMMGDNRDNSRDSRLWTNPFVRDELLKGRAFVIHWSWDVTSCAGDERGFVLDFLRTLWCVVTLRVDEIRWQRVGHSVNGVADP